MSIVIFTLTPLTNKLSGMYAEYIYENTNIEMTEYLMFYGWFNLGFAISQALVLITIFGFLITKLDGMKIDKVT